MKWLNKICLEGNAEIVITSTWRIRMSISELTDILIRSGLDKRINVAGKTDRLGRRDDEIIQWLKDHIDYNNIVILDDDIYDLTKLSDYQVFVNNYTGLTEENYQEAMRILTQPPNEKIFLKRLERNGHNGL